MSFVTSVYPGRWGGGGDSAYERGEDARRLAWECKFLDFGLT